LGTGFLFGMSGRDSESGKYFSDTEGDVVSPGVKVEVDIKGNVRRMEKMSVVKQNLREEGLQTHNTLVYCAKDFIQKPNVFSYGYAEFHKFEQDLFRIYYSDKFSNNNKVKLVYSLLAGQAATWSKTYLTSRIGYPSTRNTLAP
jgi:hypothetical protein